MKLGKMFIDIRMIKCDWLVIMSVLIRILRLRSDKGVIKSLMAQCLPLLATVCLWSKSLLSVMLHSRHLTECEILVFVQRYTTCFLKTCQILTLDPSVVASWDRLWPEAGRCWCCTAAQAERKTTFLWGGLPARCGRLPVLCSPLHQRLQETWVGLMTTLWLLSHKIKY